MPLPTRIVSGTSRNNPTGDPIVAGGQLVDIGAGPSGFGAQYDQLFANNPYRNLTYNKSKWQNFLSALGFRTGYDDFREQAIINAKEYDADVYALMQQNEYNSPAAQADRMRAAGMNPDLLGTGDVASGAQMRNDANGMPQQQSNDLQQFSGILSGIAGFAFQAITTTFGIMKDVRAVKQLDLLNQGYQMANENAGIKNATDLTNLLTDVVWKTTSPDKMPDPTTLSGSLDRTIAELFPDKKARERASAVAQEFAAGLPQDAAAWKSWHERAGSKVGYASYAGSEGYDEQVSEAMMSFYGFMRDLQNEAQQQMNSLTIGKAEEEKEYLAAHDATAEAFADNAGYAAQEETAKAQEAEQRMRGAINRTFDKWTSQLEKEANKGKTWASIALGLIGVVRLVAMNGMNFSTHQSSNHAGYGMSSGQSSGFSIGF